MFKPGQEVVCIKAQSNTTFKKQTIYGNKYIVIEDEASAILSGYISVEGLHPCVWSKNCFAPIEDWQQAETMVEVLKEDCEIEVYEPA